MYISRHFKGWQVDRPSAFNMGLKRSNGSSKERLKWTKELHDLFEKAVNQIGGPDRATPRGILRAMAIPGLTIYHVKSHLQKYRMSIFTREEDYIRSKLERRSISEMLPNFSATSGAQLSEALQIQMEAERRLSDQLEVQRSLKMKIEAQSRFLDKIMEEHKNKAAANTTTPNNKPYSPFLSLPSLSEESEQSNIKEYESDSEEVNMNTTEIRYKDDFRASKRAKVFDSFLPQIPSFNAECLYSYDGTNSNMFVEQEISYPWSLGAFESTLLPPIYNPLK